ncbi:heterokaryon incompatibility protein-domain-containing protein [Tricladium varicosporioides]|nr:heterokaryon incompatibility protein-domain-containing protein [Hymenoscyphus varicosporioides]
MAVHCGPWRRRATSLTWDYGEDITVIVDSATGPISKFGPSLSVAETTEDALPVCKLWLRECATAHTSCCSSNNTQLPTRLICIAEDKVYLTLSSSLGKLKYATLSHCWGKLKLTTLTKETLSSFQVQIPDSALSKTFKDAINITRYLGLNYLWVDSLCIIQDDAQDWKTESSLMSDVYSGSHINIAASGAEDGSVGCFFPRSASKSIFFQANSLPDKEVHNGPTYIIHPSNLKQSLIEAPLSSRAWALQERFLPSRTIYFSKNHIFWECHERFACQADPQSTHLRSAFGEFLLGNQDRKEKLTMKSWAILVQWYTCCKLTMETDKLVAISGIAKVFESELKDLYLCGLWRTNLEMQLLWGITRKTKIPVKLPGETAYVAPSWSWASCTAAVDYFEERRRQYIYPGTQIVEFDIQYETSDVFGQVKSASLYISCFGFARVKIDYFRLPYFWFWEGLRIKAYTNFDWLPAINEDNQMDGQQIYLLPLVIDGQQKSHIGLMLVPTERKNGQYKRLGTFRVGENDWSGFTTGMSSDTLQNKMEECIEAVFEFEERLNERRRLRYRQ